MPTIGAAGFKRVLDNLAAGTQPTATDIRLAKGTLDALVADYNKRNGTPATEPTPTPVQTASVFQQPGWLAVRYDALPGPTALADAGVKWVAAILSHGIDANGFHSLDNDDKTNQAWLAAGNANAYRAAGIKVGGWAWHQAQPEAEAVTAATYVSAWQLDLWIANAEDVWKPDAATYVFNGPGLFANAFAPRVRADLPVGWSVLGAAVPPNVYGYDYDAFTRRGWHILPQAYPQQSIEYKLSTCIDHATKAGVPLELVHPTIANYAPQKADAYKPTIAEWEAALKAARARGVVGFSVWAHDFPVADVKRLVQAVTS